MKQPAPYIQSFSVPFEYPVYFTRDLFSPDNPMLAQAAGRLNERRRHRFLVFVDAGVAAAHGSLIPRIQDYFETHSASMALAAPPSLVPGGEAAKNGWGLVHEIIGSINRSRLDRQSYVVAVGGGAVLDMVGFASAVVHRGLRLLRVPTTTLAQNDAGIGVKNGINDQGQKNYIGTFAPPFAVLNDALFLATLSFEQWIGGISEAFKVAIIKDAEFFEYLLQSAAALKARDAGVMAEAVRRCAVLHLDYIRGNGDPFEFGSARPLDFGHWAAHKLESMSGYAIGHGQAVAVGIAVDVCIAARQGLISDADCLRIINGLTACGLPVWDDRLERRMPDGALEIMAGLAEFREHLGGELTITLPLGIGGKTEVNAIAPDDVAAAIQLLHGAGGRPAVGGQGSIRKRGGAMFDLKSYLAEKRKTINGALERFCGAPDDASRIRQAMRYSLMAGGKRLRPILCLASAEAVGGNADAALVPACALEMVHTYSLIHDDLPAMDNDDLRRGRPTNHIRFDEATALLAGDALLTMAFEVLAEGGERDEEDPGRRIRIMHEIAVAAGCRGMIEGQMRDLAAEGVRLDAVSLEEMHSLKTGALIRASVAVGAISVGAEADDVEALLRYAGRIGLAFQVTDDILNVEGDPRVMGKAAGTDRDRQKSTYPALLGLEASRRFSRRLVGEALAAIAGFDEKAEPLRAIAGYILDRKR